MSDSAVAVCNVALSRIGQQGIMSFADNTNTARLCLVAYDPSRRSMLRMMRPGFAKKRFSVPKLATNPIWSYAEAGQLPADCLLVIEVDQPEDVRWAVEGRTIVTDGSMPLDILYIRDAQDPPEFDPVFDDALADQIAAEIVFGITKNIGYRDKFYASAAFKAEMAQNTDAQQGSPEIPPATLLTDVRF